MTFYERYARICADRGLDPCGQKAADLIGVTKATASVWNTKSTSPKAETVCSIANARHVSADYLLGRTDDPTDWTDPDLIAELSGPVMDAFDGDARKTAAFYAAVDADAKAERNSPPEFLKRYYQLDPADRTQIDTYIDGMLTVMLGVDKYAPPKASLIRHEGNILYVDFGRSE